MVFYTGDQFPAEYRNDAFVAMRGSWNRQEPVGYKVVHVDFDAEGQPVSINDFVTGWLLEKSHNLAASPVCSSRKMVPCWMATASLRLRSSPVHRCRI